MKLYEKTLIAAFILGVLQTFSVLHLDGLTIFFSILSLMLFLKEESVYQRMEYKHEGQAEWDGRQNFMQRLHNIIMQCHISSYANDYTGWYKSLMVLKIELSPHIRKEEEREKLNSSIARLKSSLYSQGGDIVKFDTFITAQESLHQIMRNRGFDVPINDHNPGQSTR